MKDTRYHRDDIVKIVEPGEELINGSHPADYGKITDIEDPQSNSPTYYVTSISRGMREQGSFKASALEKVDNWNLETAILLEVYMEVPVSQGSYSFYEDMGATFYEADGTGVNGESEWIVFRSLEGAKRAAEKKVEHDLRENPALFNNSFLRRHLYVGETDRRTIANEEADQRVRMIREDQPDLKEEVYEERREEIYDEEYEAMSDPYQHFVEDQGIYTKEEFFDLSWVKIDVKEAAEDAVSQDGVAHFLDVYDGRAVELANGAVAYATN